MLRFSFQSLSTFLVLVVWCISFPQPARADFSFSRAEEPKDMEPEQFALGLYAHEPIYIIAGGKPQTDAKFQVSFKIRLAGRWYLGYTQVNHWDIGKQSAPFRDTTHRPSLFWYEPKASSGNYPPIHFAAGYEHNSNGRDGPSSRSLDTLFVKPTYVYGDESRRHWRVAPKLFAYLTRSSQNQDVADYRRFLDIEVTNIDTNAWGASLYYRIGRGSKGSAQFDVSYPLKGIEFLDKFPGYLHFQVFNGYGETLLDYNVRRSAQLRVGYMLERAAGRSDTR